jgi:hypothetical protein
MTPLIQALIHARLQSSSISATCAHPLLTAFSEQYSNEIQTINQDAGSQKSGCLGGQSERKVGSIWPEIPWRCSSGLV